MKNIWRRKILFSEVRKKAKKEKEEIIWRRKIYFFVEEKKNRYGKEDKFGEENVF